jgi:hypothetical protein
MKRSKKEKAIRLSQKEGKEKNITNKRVKALGSEARFFMI